MDTGTFDWRENVDALADLSLYVESLNKVVASKFSRRVELRTVVEIGITTSDSGYALAIATQECIATVFSTGDQPVSVRNIQLP